jgi:hypothetical protein
MYGMSVRVEAAYRLAKPALLEELAMFLKQCKEWCVYLALVKRGLWVLHDRILFEGTFFAGCCSVEGFVSPLCFMNGYRCTFERTATGSARGHFNGLGPAFP